jgi:peptide-methionine (S)-S-oxide reductase
MRQYIVITILPIIALVAILFGGILTMSSDKGSSRKKETGVARTAGVHETKSVEPDGLERATFGSGCFWCTEAVYQQLKGVHSVVSGYSGGHVANPTYEQVCSETTGHAEVIQVAYDPNAISFPELLEVFWATHDPTTLNRQGHDVGTQYRSAIFYHTEQQREQAEHYKQKLSESEAFDSPIVTEIAPFKQFYPAEAYHQNYYADNPRQPYCAAIIRPKLDKFKSVFKEKLKSTP